MTTKGTIRKTDGGRYEVRFERQLAHPPAKVWRALTDNAELAHWFPAIIEGKRAAGAPLRFVFRPDVGPAVDAEMASVVASSQTAVPDEQMKGEIRIFEPDRVLEFTWHDEVLRFELAPRDGGTRLVFTHTLDKRTLAGGVGAGWHMCFEALEHLLDGRPPVPLTKALYDRRNAEYAALMPPD
jgi:uncharacterized protein YndB with AHSA1/START domain